MLQYLEGVVAFRALRNNNKMESLSVRATAGRYRFVRVRCLLLTSFLTWTTDRRGSCNDRKSGEGAVDGGGGHLGDGDSTLAVSNVWRC